MSKKDLAIASCRVSTPEQVKNGSLGRQHDNVVEAANNLGVDIVKYWSGDQSSKRGTNVNRPDIQEMIAFCKQNKQVKYLIVDEPDRFMRSIDEAAYFEVSFRQLGVTVWYASDPELNKGDLASKLLKFTKYLSAEGSNEERIHKSINGHTTAMNAGKYPFHPKSGYMCGVQKGIPDIHPVRGIALRDVLTRMAEHAVTPTQGLIELNKSDYTLDRAPLKMDKFRKIATDPFYAGIVEISKQVKVRNEQGKHEPLITLEQHQELMRIFDNKKKNQSGPRKNGNPSFLLNTITQHDTCLDLKNKGKLVGFEHDNGKNHDRIYARYRCRSCNLLITRDELHPKVVQLFNDNPITEEGTQNFIEALDIVWKKKEAQARQDSARTGQKIKDIGNDIDNRAIAAIDPSNIAIKAEILASIEKLKAQKQDMEKELFDLEQKMDADKDKFLKFAFGFVENMGESFFALTPYNAKKCKQIIFPAGFYLDAEKNVYTPEISPLITLATNKKDLPGTEKSFMVRSYRIYLNFLKH